MSKLIFIGTVYPESQLNQLIKDGLHVEYASNTFQRALLAGFSENKCRVHVLSAPPMPSFPKYCLFYKHINISENLGDTITGSTMSFLNLPLIRLISKFISLSYNLVKNLNTGDNVLIYEVTSWQLLAAVLFASKNKKYLLVPDLPEFMSSNDSRLYLFLKRIDRILIDYAIKRINGFILLSEPMADYLNVGNRPFVILEGIYNPQTPSQNEIIVKEENSKIVLYSGKIEERFGLRELLEAFTMIEGEEYKLWLCGNGDVSMINEYVRKDNRINFWGSLPREQVLQMQRRANLLVNPRHSNEDFTKYSFPSKTMEYMASGTPTVMCKLSSIPEEYHQFLFFFDDESVNGMSNRIKELLDLPQEYMFSFGKQASDFIFKNKNSYHQTRKIIDLFID